MTLPGFLRSSFGAAGALIAVLLVAGCSSPENPTVGGGTARVEFVQPEKFTDLQTTDYIAADSRAVLLPKIESFITEEAARSVPAGRQLNVQIRDIDQAGSIRLVSGNRIRVSPDSEPALIELDYQLLASSGAILKSAHETLNSFGRPPTASGQRTEELHTEKELLRRWIRRVAN